MINDSDPNSPEPRQHPRIKGTVAGRLTTVKLYTDATCTGSPVATGTAASFTSPGLQVTLANDTSTTFYANATDAADNVSACSSGSLTYVEDSTAPAVASSGSSVPASPGNDNTPQITGTAPPNTTVALYSDALCNTLVGEGSSAAFTTTGIQVTVAENSTTTFYATTTDMAQNTSACTAIGATYVEDSNPPAVAVVSGTAPGSPSADNAPRVRGTAPAGTTVRIYRDAACAGAIAGEGTAVAFATPGIPVTVRRQQHHDVLRTVGRPGGQRLAVLGQQRDVRRGLRRAADHVGSGPTGSRADVHVRLVGCRLDLRVPGRPRRLRAVHVAVHGPGARQRARTRSRCAPSMPPATSTRRPRGARSRSTAPAVPPPPPPAAAKRPQPGCIGIAGRLYVGTSAANIRSGAAGTDIMFGLGGKDTLRGLAGLDCIYGGFGNDVIQGGSGGDRLFGDSGSDRLDGQSGNDRLSGQGGSDRINGGTGNDYMTGGAGNDRLTDRRGKDRLSGGSGIDRLDARDTRAADRRKADRILCGPGRDTVIADRRDSIARDCERVSLR